MDRHDMVELRIPRKPEYVAVARLAVSGIALRMNLSSDEVNDVKDAVGEACNAAIRAAASCSEHVPVILRFGSVPGQLSIEVIDPCGADAAQPAPPALETDPTLVDYEADPTIGEAIMREYMDEVAVDVDGEGNHRIRMVKYAPTDAAKDQE